MKDAPRAFPYVALFLRDGEAQRAPMEEGGAGRYFVYLTNRNHCTYLFDARELDAAFHDTLSATFPTGYAQLYVLEKVAPGAAGRAATGRCCVFQDPGCTNVGLGATISFHPNAHEAVLAAREHRRSTGFATIVARVVDEETWH